MDYKVKYSYVCNIFQGAAPDSQDIDKDSHSGGDEHDVGINGVVLMDDSQDGLVQQHTSEDPDKQYRHNGPQHLCSERMGCRALSHKYSDMHSI